MRSGARHFGVTLAGLVAGCVAPNSPEACRVKPVVEMALKGRLPIIEVSIEGRPARFLLDTGATSVVITEAAFDRLGLRYAPQAIGYMTSVEAKSPARITDTVRIEIGGHALTPVNVSVVPSASMLEGKAPIDGLLGLAAIANFDVDLDIPHRRVGLAEGRHCAGGAPPFAGPSDTFTLPANQYRFAFVPAMVDGHSLALIADTGAMRTYLNQAEVGLSDADLADDLRFTARTAGPGHVAVHIHRFPAVQIGSATFMDVPLTVGRLQLPAGGLLGDDFWRTRRAWFSFVGGAITIQRNDSPLQPPSRPPP